MEIKNYRCIRDFSLQLQKVNVMYGQNGIGKTTIKKVLNFASQGIPIPNDPNIDSPSPDSVIHAEEVQGYTPLTFDEDYVKKYIYTNNSLKEASKYDVLFSKGQLDELKTNVKGIISFAVLASQKLTELYLKLQKTSQLIDTHFSDTGIKAKLKNITKQSITGSNDMSLLSFARKTDDMYIWWRNGFQSFWDVSNPNCIFCNQKIDNSPIRTLLLAKQNETINTKTQMDFIKDIDVNKDAFSDKYASSINALRTTIIDSCTTDASSRLIEHKDAMLPIVHLSETILSKRDRLNQYINKIELMKTDGLRIVDTESILSHDLADKLQEYNDLIDKIQLEVESYNKLLAENKRVLTDMISGNEILFNQILEMFGLSYKIKIKDEGLNLEKEQVDFMFNLTGKESNTVQDIVDRSSDVLSFGEKNTIAFAFYVIDCINKLNRRSEGAKFLFILDDPISSHDIFRKYSTVDVLNKHLIKKMHNDDIFIIFTHEFEMMLPIRETIISSEPNSSFIGMKSKNGHINPEKITSSNLINTIARLIKHIKSTVVHPISKVSMLRVLREFDSEILGFRRNTDWLYSYLCDIIHFRRGELIFNEDEYREFIGRYGVKDVLLRSFSDYSSLFSNIDLFQLTDIDKYFILRPYIEFLLSSEALTIDGFSYRSYSNSKLVAFIDSNFTFLNSSVHHNHNEDEPTFYDIKEFEMFSTSIFDKFIEAIK
ncbi:MAG: AAA family ATPase [Patescibacteria group bacterium]